MSFFNLPKNSFRRPSSPLRIIIDAATIIIKSATLLSFNDLSFTVDRRKSRKVIPNAPGAPGPGGPGSLISFNSVSIGLTLVISRPCSNTNNGVSC